MAELRLVEHYTSVQGEGPRTGVMTQFVRFAGCNMRCPGWPCDTQHAIQPSIYLRKKSPTQEAGSYKRTPQELVGDVIQKAHETGARNICLTGGEPFMQPIEKMTEFIKAIAGTYTIEAFSNGSFTYTLPILERVNFIMDWKLPGSGEADTALSNRLDNALRLKDTDAIKFVVTNYVDELDALKTYRMLKEADCKAMFYIGAAWDRITVPEILKFIEDHKLDWKVNVQVHKYIWDPDKQGV